MQHKLRFRSAYYKSERTWTEHEKASKIS